MPSVDMFDETFHISKKLTGKIKWTKEQVNVLSAYVIQVNGAGEVSGAAYGVAVKNPDRPNDFPIKNNGLIVAGEPQPTWTLTMRMVPGKPLQVGTPATGLALYRKGAILASWITSPIAIEA